MVGALEACKSTLKALRMEKSDIEVVAVSFELFLERLTLEII